ncbi:MAG: PilZ domain-containing protein [Nitrospirota bacterium]
MAGMESRGGVRVRIDATAMVEVDKAMKEQVRILREPQKVTIADVSTVGLGLVSPVFLPKGAILVIKMESAIFNFDKPISLKGEVRYCKPSKEGRYKVGIKFVEVENDVLNKIKEYVTKGGQ